MEKEVMNKELVENFAEAGKVDGKRKVSVIFGVVGLTIGLTYLMRKFGKKLKTKMTVKKPEKPDAISVDDEIFNFDVSELEN